MSKLTKKEFKQYLEINPQMAIIATVTALSLILVNELKISKKKQEEYLEVATNLLFKEVNKNSAKVEQIKMELQLKNDPFFNIIFGGGRK